MNTKNNHPKSNLQHPQNIPFKPLPFHHCLSQAEAFLPPLGCFLSFAVFPTANALAAAAGTTHAATAQGLISGSRPGERCFFNKQVGVGWPLLFQRIMFLVSFLGMISGSYDVFWRFLWQFWVTFFG